MSTVRAICFVVFLLLKIIPFFKVVYMSNFMFFIVEERTGFLFMRIRYFIPSQIKGKHFPSCTQGYCVCVCVSSVFLFLIHEVAYFCRAHHYLANLLLAAIQMTNFFIITFSNFANGLSANILYLVS